MSPAFGMGEAVVGLRFTRLLVVAELPRNHGLRVVLAKCDCGQERRVHLGNLKARRTLSCGCHRLEKGREAKKHGLTRTPEYRIWSGIITRCENPRVWNFYRYGGRGVGMCPRWRGNFEAFLEDMGPRPSKAHSIDRLDNAGNYEPGNCRWATATQQARNRHNTVHLTIKGVTKSLPEWAEMVGLPPHRVHNRLRKGWSPERAVFQELRRWP